MTTIQFKQTRDMFGNIRTDAIQYMDESGQVWFIPQGHRIWIEIYLPWLAEGNTPLGPDDPWAEN